jgi:hypothetical protein
MVLYHVGCVKVGGEPVTADELRSSFKYGFRRFPELRSSSFSYQNRKKTNLEVALMDCWGPRKSLCERQKSGRDGRGSFAVPSPFATPRYVPAPRSREAHGEVTRVGGSGRTATLAGARRRTPFWRDGVYLPRQGASGVLPHTLSLAQGVG